MSHRQVVSPHRFRSDAGGAYDDLVLNDRQLLEAFDVARTEQALVMVQCKGFDTIRFMTERLERAGKTEPF